MSMLTASGSDCSCCTAFHGNIQYLFKWILPVWAISLLALFVLYRFEEDFLIFERADDYGPAKNS